MKERFKLAFPYVKQFLYGFVLDTFWLLWMLCATKHYVLLTGLMSVCVALPGILGYSAMMSNKRMIPPYLLGLACGSMFSVYMFPN